MMLVYVTGPKGPEPQRWASAPSGDYWGHKAGRVVLAVALSEDDARLSLDSLAKKFPAPCETVTAAEGQT